MNYFFYSTYEKITKRIFQVILRRINKFFYLFLFESFILIILLITSH